MYDRQVTQPLEFVAIDFAEESVWGLLDDIPNQTENVLMSSTPPILENRQTTGNGGPKTTDTSVTGVQNEEEHRVALVGASATAPEVPAEEKIPASSSTSRSQEATPRGRTTDGQSSTTLHNEKNADPDVNDEMSQATGENVNQEASKKNDESVETPKNAATHQTSGPDSSGMPEADEKFENNGEWSDVEDSDHEEAEEEDDSAPVLGNYKVTRGPTNNQDDNDVPMLGSHKVTRGPAPVNDGPGIPTLGKYKVTRGETPADDRSGVPEAEKKSGSDGEWSDVEDEEEEKKENGEEEGGARGFTPMNTNFVAMLGNHQVTRPSTPAKVNSGKEAEQNSRNNSQPSSPCPAPKRDPPQENVAASLPVPQSESPAQGTPVATTKAARDGKTAIRHTSDIFPSTKNTTKTHAEVVGDAFADYVREHGTRKLEDSMWADKPNANKQALPQQAPSTPAEGVAGEVTRGPPRPPANIRGPTNSQPPPGIPTGMRGHASPNHDPERSVSRFETSAEIEDPDTTPRVRLPSPPSYDPDNPNEIPRVRLPPWLKGFQARPAPVIPETAPSTQGELEEGPGPQMAPVGTQVARAFDPRSKPPYRGSPLRNEIRATSVEKNNAGTQHTPGAAPAGSASRSDGWFPRGNGRGGRGGLGGQGVRGAHTPVRQTATHGSTANTATATPIAPEAEDDFKILGASRRGDSGGNDGRGAHQAPAQSPPGNNTRAEPITPSADDGTQSPNFNVRGRGGGQAGRGGHRAGRQQQGPTVRLSTPNTPRAAPAATTNNDNHTPPAYRGGQNGQATPTPQPKPTRGSESANSSFRRQQEQMAKLAAESARKREARGGGKSVNSSFMRQQERMAQSAAEEARKGE